MTGEHVWAPLTVSEVADLMRGCPARWWLSGGRAVDHWLGADTREHHDTDISTLRPELTSLLRYLPERLEPLAAMSGDLLPLADHLTDPELHNIWVRDRSTGAWVLQVNLEEGDADRWAYRRLPSIMLPWGDAVRVVRGVPTGTPATQLLWKSKGPRPRDDHDLEVVLEQLSPTERRWLWASVRTAHPSSPWLAGMQPPTVPPG